METLEKILNEDDQVLGSFGSAEKGVGYAIVFCMSLPILLTPVVFYAAGRSILRLTYFLAIVWLALLTVLHFRFAWLIWLTHRFQEIYGRIRI